MTAEHRSDPSLSVPTRRWHHPLWLALSALSGTTWFLATADFDIWPLAWVGMVPCYLAIERATTRRRALLYGFVCGLVTNAGGFYWIIGLLERFASMPWPLAVLVFLLLAAYQALPFVLFAWAVRSIRLNTRLPMTLLAPVVFVTFELAVPFIFPFYLAISQAWQLHVIQIADLTGPLGVTALLFMTSGAIYDLALARPRRVVPAITAAVIVAGCLVYGHVRLGQVLAARAQAPKIKVGMVQPNVSFDMKGVENPELAQKELFDLQDRSRLLALEGADLIVWPESGYPYAFSRLARSDWPSTDGRQVQRGFATPLIFGAVTVAPWRDGPRPYPYNTALLLDREGRIAGAFDKIFLLMFGEYIPGLETFPWLRKILPQQAGHFARGKDVTTFPFATADGRVWRLAPMICYEDIMPSLGRQIGKLHPHLLVNLTNDAWFGDSSEPWQHLALSVFRSVELRTDLVRAVNTGVTAYIDATGRVYNKTYAVNPTVNPKPAEGILDEVALMEGGHTVYARVGDLFGYLNLLACVGLWIVWPRWQKARARRRAS